MMIFSLSRTEEKFSYGGLALCLIGMGLLQGAAPALGQAGVTPGHRGRGTAEAPYNVPKTDSSIHADGVLRDGEWGDALVLELDYEVEPGENVSPPVRTEVLLTHDEHYLYAAFRCYDPEPSKIRAHLSDRDRIGDDDWVGIILDTFNDQRRSFDLTANPLGVQDDWIETESGGISWDGIWDSGGRITDWGYAVEMSIPFNQLRFQRTNGPQVWGFDAVRRYPRSQRHHIGTFPRDRSNNCYLCQAIKIQSFDDVSPGRNVEISPTVVAVRTDARDEMPDGAFRRENQRAELGVTGTWGLTPNLTFTATAHPDFSQVEADALQLDVNQPFALYYSERRPFFTEGTDFFRTLKSVIYTRTMREPNWGLKLTGKESVHTIGGYVVRDNLTNLIFPGSQSSSSTSLAMESTASVLRYKRDIGSRYTLGALVTDREAGDYFNRVLGLDANLLLTNTDQIQLQLLGTSTRYSDDIADTFGQPKGRFDDAHVAFEYDHDSRTAGWWLDYDYVGRDFRADLGYIPMVGFRNVEGGLNYTWNAPQGSWWAEFSAGNEFNYYEDLDGNLLERTASLWFYYEGIQQSWVLLRSYRSREGYQGRQFDLTWYQASSGFRPSPSLSLGFATRLGDRIDYANARLGERLLLNPYLTYNLGRHLRLNLDHTYERLTVEGGRLYTANISELRAVYQFNVRTFFRGILQHVDYQYNTGLYTFDIDSEYRQFFTQLLFSYTINPRTVLFLGYSENHFGSQEYGLTRSDRTFFAKVGYAWIH